MSEILRIENVRKYFGRFAAVDDISIGLKEGGIYLLVGPNGCGKTTLTNCISGIFHAEEGVEGLTGILMCGWSAAFIFAVVSQMCGEWVKTSPKPP